MKKASTLPLLLSGLLLPGAGQWAQQRWLAGAVYALSFLAAFTVFIVSVFRILGAFYAMGFDFNRATPERLPAMPAALALLAAVLIYLVSLFDTYRAYLRNASRRRPPPIPGM